METGSSSSTQPINMNKNFPKRGRIKAQIIRDGAKSLLSVARRAGEALGIPPPPASPSQLPAPGPCNNLDYLSTSSLAMEEEAYYSTLTSIPRRGKIKSQIFKDLAESLVSVASMAAHALCGGRLRKEKKTAEASAIIHPQAQLRGHTITLVGG